MLKEAYKSQVMLNKGTKEIVSTEEDPSQIPDE